MTTLHAINPTAPGALNTVLRWAANISPPAIGSHTPREKTFKALLFGFDDVIIMPSCDGRNVYVKHAGKSRIFCARHFEADLDRMAAYAEEAPTLHTTMRRYCRKQPRGIRMLKALHPPLSDNAARDALAAEWDADRNAQLSAVNLF